MKRLARRGCDLVVFTTETGAAAEQRDDGLLREAREIAVCVRSCGHSSWKLIEQTRRGPVAKVLGLLLRALLQPDVHRPWAEATYRRVAQLHRTKPFDVIFTTSFPWSAHVVGLKAKERLGIPWVSDFRDPWTLNYEFRNKALVRLWLHRRMEQRVYDASDHVVVNTEGNLRDVLRNFTVNPDKITALVNGFDPEDFIGAETAPPHNDGRFHLLYLGGLRGDWFEAPFHQALAELRRRSPSAYRKLAVDFGGASGPCGRLCDALELRDVCRFHGFRPQREVGEWLARTDACLLLLPPARKGAPLGWIPQKTFLYLYSGKPIFFMGASGAATEILEATNAGERYGAGDVHGAADALGRWVKAWEAGSLPAGASRDVIGQYDKRVLTERLAEIFERVQGGVPPEEAPE